MITDSYLLRRTYAPYRTLLLRVDEPHGCLGNAQFIRNGSPTHSRVALLRAQRAHGSAGVTSHLADAGFGDS